MRREGEGSREANAMSALSALLSSASLRCSALLLYSYAYSTLLYSFVCFYPFCASVCRCTQIKTYSWDNAQVRHCTRWQSHSHTTPALSSTARIQRASEFETLSYAVRVSEARSSSSLRVRAEATATAGAAATPGERVFTRGAPLLSRKSSWLACVAIAIARDETQRYS